jgi:hypothetical protein
MPETPPTDVYYAEAVPQIGLLCVSSPLCPLCLCGSFFVNQVARKILRFAQNDAYFTVVSFSSGKVVSIRFLK